MHSDDDPFSVIGNLMTTCVWLHPVGLLCLLYSEVDYMTKRGLHIHAVLWKMKHYILVLVKHTLYGAICSHGDDYIVTQICMARNKTLCPCTVWICLQGLTWMQFHVIWMPFMRQGLFWTVLKSSSTTVAASGPGYRGVMSTGPINDGASESEWMRSFERIPPP